MGKTECSHLAEHISPDKLSQDNPFDVIIKQSRKFAENVVYKAALTQLAELQRIKT